jgi:hypothetical protein
MDHSCVRFSEASRQCVTVTVELKSRVDSCVRKREEEQSGPFTMFSKFTDLPKEIRMKIWTYTITPRIVPIRCRLIRSSQEDTTGDRRFQSHFEYFSGCSLPSIFHICQEARSGGLRIYQPIFSTPHSTTGVLHNRSLDTVYLPWSEFHFAERKTAPRIFTISNLIATVPVIDIENLKYLAVDVEIRSNAWQTTNEGRKVSRFGSLKEFTIVYDGGQLPNGLLVEEDIDLLTESPETPFWLSNLHAVIKERFPDWEMPQWKLKELGERQDR